MVMISVSPCRNKCMIRTSSLIGDVISKLRNFFEEPEYACC